MEKIITHSKVIFLLIIDNWKAYSFPLFMAFYIPFLAWTFNELTFHVIFGSVFILLSCIMGMADRDFGKSLYCIVKAQEAVFSDKLAEQIAKNGNNSSQDITIHIKDDDVRMQ